MKPISPDGEREYRADCWSIGERMKREERVIYGERLGDADRISMASGCPVEDQAMQW